GLFYNDASEEIPSIIRYLDQDEDKIVEMGIAANQQYNYDLGGDTIKQKLYHIMTEKSLQRIA
ncbi:MAG: hypothetical protein AAGE93_17035, partial [Bacteroidota bacterium]